jgi:hypothetical protein
VLQRQVKQVGCVGGGGVEDGLERFVSQLGYVLRNVSAKRQQELYTNERMASNLPLTCGTDTPFSLKQRKYKGKSVSDLTQASYCHLVQRCMQHCSDCEHWIRLMSPAAKKTDGGLPYVHT